MHTCLLWWPLQNRAAGTTTIQSFKKDFHILHFIYTVGPGCPLISGQYVTCSRQQLEQAYEPATWSSAQLSFIDLYNQIYLLTKAQIKLNFTNWSKESKFIHVNYCFINVLLFNLAINSVWETIKKWSDMLKHGEFFAWVLGFIWN